MTAQTTTAQMAGRPPRGRDTAKIRLEAAAKDYTTDSGDTVRALAPTDLEIREGEFVCIVGPSGCGKSTLMDMVAGFHAPSSGAVVVDGEPVEGPSAARGVVFQQANLLPWKSVRANVELGPRLRGVPAQERREAAERELALVGLEAFADRKPYELSGGMQQRAQIARVLANDPAVILMDEPFGALDALSRERLQVELRGIWRQDRKTIVFITHSIDEAVYLGTRVLVMSPRPGRIALDLPVEVGRDHDDVSVRTSPEFTALRERIAAAIYGDETAPSGSATVGE
ncbi:ABC transporter ATP-binding protein [Kocuria palustris]|uniref:ABC transporter ATP-binding protein n=1 Tax=Kocuria palustris TaxID=71999 RepID=UPI0021B281AC|nr:ABC transporter ATP-binding protein [Kocuria palustris]